MNEYLLLFRGGEEKAMAQPPDAFRAHMRKWMEWLGGLKKEGVHVAAQPLSRTGRTVEGTNNVVTDGPYMEGKEIVGGFLLCKASSYDDAMKIASKCPVLEFGGTVEVRETTELEKVIELYLEQHRQNHGTPLPP